MPWKFSLANSLLRLDYLRFLLCDFPSALEKFSTRTGLYMLARVTSCTQVEARKCSRSRTRGDRASGDMHLPLRACITTVSMGAEHSRVH
eukprot:6178328-Pleurochrysis_carterae.AAC.1